MRGRGGGGGRRDTSRANKESDVTSLLLSITCPAAAGPAGGLFCSAGAKAAAPHGKKDIFELQDNFLQAICTSFKKM